MSDLLKCSCPCPVHSQAEVVVENTLTDSVALATLLETKMLGVPVSVLETAIVVADATDSEEPMEKEAAEVTTGPVKVEETKKEPLSIPEEVALTRERLLEETKKEPLAMVVVAETTEGPTLVEETAMGSERLEEETVMLGETRLVPLLMMGLVV